MLSMMQQAKKQERFSLTRYKKISISLENLLARLTSKKDASSDMYSTLIKGKYLDHMAQVTNY